MDRFLLFGPTLWKPVVVIALACVSAGCLVPLPQEVPPDGGGVNDTPTIVDENPEMPGPITVTPGIYSIDVRDADIGDTIYVRVFRNYTEESPVPPFYTLVIANDPVEGSEIRSVPLETYFWCAGAPTDVNLVFDVLVADRPFDQDATRDPPFRVVTEPGRSSIRSWVGVCPAS